MGRLRTRTVFADQGLTVSVAESLEFCVDQTERMRLATGALRPVAVIVNGPEGPRAFGMDGLPVDIDQLGLAAGTVSR
jgi:hypothetical protein